MTINEIKFPIYGVMIILSILLGMLYIFLNIKEDIKKDNRLLLYFVLVVPFTILFGLYFSMVTSMNFNIFEVGLSSYGGLIGLILSSIIFEKILPTKWKIFKYTILALPFIYGISKLGCTFVGCCYGIPYNGPLNISYPFRNVYNVFPVQLTEVLVFIIAFFILNRFKDIKNIIPITVITGATLKFLLDFLRHSHINQILSVNQIFSLVLVVIAVIFIVKNKKKTKRNK